MSTTGGAVDPNAERNRVAENPTGEAGPWRQWGPYLSARAWGTVREDYSADGDAWGYLPFEQARSRAFRWSEDGLGGICDIRQQACFAWTFWNGRDAIPKERYFGLSNPQGNHGEDVKEYWWYLDATPSHAWMRWRYHYPQDAFPYDDLVATNAARSRDEPEYELVDTGVFDDDRYWQITADYAKARSNDICVRLTVRNAGQSRETLHVLPTLWFRNTWAWDPSAPKPSLSVLPEIPTDVGVVPLMAQHEELGRYLLLAGEAPDGSKPEVLCCENETNVPLLFHGEPVTPYPKDGIGDHVMHGAATVNPDRQGTKASFWYPLTLDPGASAELRLRLVRADRTTPEGGYLGPDFEATLGDREREADAFYASLTPTDATPDEAMVMRQAFAGMIWGKQFYHYDVERWLEGDPGQPVPPAERKQGRNAEWQHLNNLDVISMPDPWEYPWYAAWDLAFHCVTLAHLDPEFAKHQLVLLCREWYQHPNGELPAYEWDFGDVNPPVHAWAALRVYQLDGSADHAFLARVFQKLLLNFTWWVNRKDSTGTNVFSGGFLGLDNIGPFDRSKLPIEGSLEQSDGTAWMARYCLDMLQIALTLSRVDRVYEDLTTKFFEHFAYIATAMNSQGLWDDHDGFYYDVLRLPNGSVVPMRIRTIAGLVSLCAVAVLDGNTVEPMRDFVARANWFVTHKPQSADVISETPCPGGGEERILSVLDLERLERVLQRVFDEAEFLSPHGLRSVSKWHEAHPFDLVIEGYHAYLDYQPGESRTADFGGNSNWRGPVWFPLNYLVIVSLDQLSQSSAQHIQVELPTGSGNRVPLREAVHELSRRLVAIFLDDADGRRPVFGSSELFQTDPAWHDLIPFHEYFHGDTGAGLGASHQTGWTGLVAHLITMRRFAPAPAPQA